MSYHSHFTSFYQRRSCAKLLETPLGAELGLKWHWSGINNCEIFHMQPTYRVFDFEYFMAGFDFICVQISLPYVHFICHCSRCEWKRVIGFLWIKTDTGTHHRRNVTYFPMQLCLKPKWNAMVQVQVQGPRFYWRWYCQLTIKCQKLPCGWFNSYENNIKNKKEQ